MTKPITVLTKRQYGWSQAKADGLAAWHEAMADLPAMRAAILAGTLHSCSNAAEHYFTIRHPVPSAWGQWISECPQCQLLQFVHSYGTGGGLCTGCKAKRDKERRKPHYLKQKAERQARSAELSQRTGNCVVCGAEMTTKRVTKKTCSARCRKQLQRSPEQPLVTQ